jgi:2-methylcitrate dehydratase PrpD
MKLQKLAGFAANLRFEDLPETVIERAGWVMRDSVATMVAGLREPENRALAEHALANAPGDASLMGLEGKTTPDWAALVHATAGCALEMDEGHAFMRGHAAIHAVPTALALAEAHGRSGRDLITALIAGYEVAARCGIAGPLRAGIHPFGAWGVLGAATVAGWMKGFDAGQMARALDIAASYAITPSFDAAIAGANVRNTYPGVVNRLGLFAADLVEMGFQGLTDGAAVTFGRILGDAWQPAALVDELGERYEIMRGYFKPYSSCRYTHAAVEAALALREQLAGRIDQIEAIEVDVYALAAQLNNPDPQTPLAGRFSLPYVTAATLVYGEAGPDNFSLARMADATVRALAASVTVREDPALTSMTPAVRPARITVTDCGGNRVSELVTLTTGDPDKPMTAEALYAKFAALTEPTIGPEAVPALWARLSCLEAEAQIGPLVPARSS